MKEEIYTIYIMDPSGKEEYRPCFTCAHCCAVVVLHRYRTRPRNRCMKCTRLICDQNEICLTHCTPLHKLANDHFEAPSEWTEMVPAIMRGATTLAQAEEINSSLEGKE